MLCPFSKCPTALHRGVSSNDFPGLENLCKKIMKEKQPFERLEIKKETLLEMFKVRGGFKGVRVRGYTLDCT